MNLIIKIPTVRKLSIELPYDPESPLLGIYSDKTFLEKDMCTHMFIAALFTIAKTWKKPKCPLKKEWIKKVRCICTIEYYSAIKKDELMPLVATWMDLETLILCRVNQTD